jgi:hypothetical protein
MYMVMMTSCSCSLRRHTRAEGKLFSPRTHSCEDQVIEEKRNGKQEEECNSNKKGKERKKQWKRKDREKVRVKGCKEGNGVVEIRRRRRRDKEEEKKNRRNN